MCESNMVHKTWCVTYEKLVKTALYTSPTSHNHASWYEKLRATRYAYSQFSMDMLNLKEIMLKNDDLI